MSPLPGWCGPRAHSWPANAGLARAPPSPRLYNRRAGSDVTQQSREALRVCLSCAAALPASLDPPRRVSKGYLYLSLSLTLPSLHLHFSTFDTNLQGLVIVTVCFTHLCVICDLCAYVGVSAISKQFVNQSYNLIIYKSIVRVF